MTEPSPTELPGTPFATELVIISGVSGSGKSTAIKAFEDSGYLAVDNLPVPLIEHFVDYLLNLPPAQAGSVGSLQHTTPAAIAGQRKFALLIDCRDATAFPIIRRAVERLRGAGVAASLLFFDCQDEVVIRRFRETRRPHPLLIGSSLVKTIGAALVRERELLASFRENADVIFDTSAYTVHDLRREIERYCGSEAELELYITSFGFKYGAPIEADLVLDVRFLKNPHFDTELRAKTGLDQEVVDYVSEDPGTAEVIARYGDLLTFLVPRYKAEGKRYLTIAIGCTGGRHRSVAIAETLAARLQSASIASTVIHRDISRASVA
jgi:UPF0042 nucleotide-binding protein